MHCNVGNGNVFSSYCKLYIYNPLKLQQYKFKIKYLMKMKKLDQLNTELRFKCLLHKYYLAFFQKLDFIKSIIPGFILEL